MSENATHSLSHSPTIAELAKALSAAQAEFQPVVKNSTNPFFRSKYADLSALLEATRPALAKHQLVLVQSPRLEADRVVVTSMLLHSSGEWLRGDFSLPAGQKEKFDAQSVGSAVSYARRYSYQSLLGLAAEDDDGNAAVAKAVHNQPSDEPPQVINEAQRKRVFSLARENGVSPDKLKVFLKRTYSVDSSKQIPASAYSQICAWLTSATQDLEITQDDVEQVSFQLPGDPSSVPADSGAQGHADADGGASDLLDWERA